jgi:ABC-2 type transport system permease protein
MSTVTLNPSRAASLRGELIKLPAFFRRDLLIAWSYRMAFFTTLAGMFLQALMFYFVGKMVNPDVLPEFGGARVTYMEFVAVGLALSAFIALGLGQVATAVRSEQMMGTLESLLMTPTAPATIQLGSVLYALVFIPLRMLLFLALLVVAFGVDLRLDGVLPAAVVLVSFVPFIFGLGLLSAAAVLTFKQGTVGIGFTVTLLTIGSGAFYPLEVLPGWVQATAEANPLALAIEGMRDALLGGAGWSTVGESVAILLPLSLVSLVAGIVAFRLGLRRERVRGSIGLY